MAVVNADFCCRCASYFLEDDVLRCDYISVYIFVLIETVFVLYSEKSVTTTATVLSSLYRVVRVCQHHS